MERLTLIQCWIHQLRQSNKKKSGHLDALSLSIYIYIVFFLWLHISICLSVTHWLLPLRSCSPPQDQQPWGRRQGTAALINGRLVIVRDTIPPVNVYIKTLKSIKTCECTNSSIPASKPKTNAFWETFGWTSLPPCRRKDVTKMQRFFNDTLVMFVQRKELGSGDSCTHRCPRWDANVCHWHCNRTLAPARKTMVAKT